MPFVAPVRLCRCAPTARYGARRSRTMADRGPRQHLCQPAPERGFSGGPGQSAVDGGRRDGSTALVRVFDGTPPAPTKRSAAADVPADEPMRLGGRTPIRLAGQRPDTERSCLCALVERLS